MSKKILFLVLSFFITTHTFAQNDCFEVLNQTFDSITSQSQIWGFSAAMLLPDGCLWKRASGTAQELPDEQPLTTDHVMGIGSVTKSFVSATILLMMEDGLLNLDDPIGMYLAPYPNVPPEATIRQLLSHTSGIANYLPFIVNAWNIYPDSIWVIDTILHHYLLGTNSPLGTYKYSDTNYLLACRIIEEGTGTGQSWYEVVRERILDPLGLTHTYAYPYELPNQPFAHVWDNHNGDYEDLQGNGTSLDGVFAFGAGAGGLISNPEDLARFSERLHGGHLLQPSSLQEMHTDYPGTGINGLGVKSLGNNVWGHGGAIFYYARAYYYTNDSMALVVQQNDSRQDGSGSMYIDFREVNDALRDAFLTVSTTDYHPEESFRVFPNPAKDKITLDVSENLSINDPLPCFLIDATGRVLQTFKIEGNRTELFVGQMPKGLYFIKVGNSTMKISLIRD
ncbi:MAG: serine hydrolase [Phaeodactylibacter sp.]|nr:serine hydrolase [Phaeodactylibacter sp.]